MPNNWQGVQECAAKAGAKFPELVAAQWALESGFGKHTSGKHNYFGLKGNGTISTTQEYYDGKWVTIDAGFIDFSSLGDCISYLVNRWHKDWKQYKGVNQAKDRDAAAEMLVSEGYATDPAYAAKLKRLMNEHAPRSSGLPSQRNLITMSTPIRLVNAAKHFNGESHQIAAWNWLESELTKEQLAEFAEIYRAAPAVKPSNPLSVPYFSQRDNASGEGYRECFSSSCAMIAAFHGKVKGDDEYNRIRSQFGDTVEATAQCNALKQLGLRPVYRQNVTLEELQNEVKAGRPVAVGWLHHGPYNKPSGGGHWTVFAGFGNGSAIHLDPYGICDIVNGGYKSALGGKFVHYGEKYWLPRWSVKGSADGWALFVRP